MKGVSVHTALNLGELLKVTLGLEVTQEVKSSCCSSRAPTPAGSQAHGAPALGNRTPSSGLPGNVNTHGIPSDT